MADEKRTVDVMTYTVFTSLLLKDNLGEPYPHTESSSRLSAC